MAMSQFSYGTLASYRMRGEQLPVEGGFDAEGRLTRDPAAIEASQRALPIGYWKGSGLALVLDLLATLLSAGQATHQIPRESERETKLSQVFIAIDPSPMDQADRSARFADEIVEQFQATRLGASVRYPGQRVLQVREENLAKGVPVEPLIWHEVQKLCAAL
jgi:3-dehydro-L-gulonate 2-dehydrogenase